MSDWERALDREVEREGIPPVLARQPSRLSVATRNKQRRGADGANTPTAGATPVGPNVAAPAAASSPMPASLRALAQQKPPQRQSGVEDDDPFAAHASPQQSQPFVHPLMAEPIGGPSQAHLQRQQARQEQLQQQYYSGGAAGGPGASAATGAAAADRDPNLRRIESSLRNTLDRPPSTMAGAKQLPPLGGRPVVPPLKLGDVINKVLGPARGNALLSNAAASSQQQQQQQQSQQSQAAADAQSQDQLRGLVRGLRLHESVNPALVPSAAVAAMDAAELARVGAFLVSDPQSEAALPYDENDEDDEDDVPAAQQQADEERRPLSPPKQAGGGGGGLKKDLPTSRLAIDRDDLARRPEELVDSAGATAIARRDELMQFRVNNAYASAAAAPTSAIMSAGATGAAGGGGVGAPSVSNTMNGGGGSGGGGIVTSMEGTSASASAAGLGESRGRTSLGASLRSAFGLGMGGGGGGGSSAPTAASRAAAAAAAASSAESFVESKTTGEFIRVRGAASGDGSGMGLDGVSNGGAGRGSVNPHNIADFDVHIDTIIDRVDQIQGVLNAAWLLLSGLLVGACLIQVYLSQTPPTNTHTTLS